MRRAGMLLLLASCSSSADPFEREAPQAWSGTEAFNDATTRYRHLQSGLAERAVAEGPYQLGRPVHLRIQELDIRP